MNIYIAMYVDDLLILGESAENIEKTQQMLCESLK